MCVIAVCENIRMNDQFVRQCWARNPHGGGIAWRQGSSIHWEKGLDLDAMLEMAREAPLPYVMHFRVASCGGQVPELTHPFPITRNVSLQLEGNAKEVLFHNGHWTQYEEKVIDHMVMSQLAVPDGPWSDSRVAAWISAKLGTNWLKFIGSRWVIFSASKLIRVGNEGKDGWNEWGGIWFSNDFWRYYHDTPKKKGGNYHCDYVPPTGKPSAGSTLNGTLIGDGESKEGSPAPETFRGNPTGGSESERSRILLPAGYPSRETGNDQSENHEEAPPLAEQKAIAEALKELGVDEDDIEWAMAFNRKIFRSSHQSLLAN